MSRTLAIWMFLFFGLHLNTYAQPPETSPVEVTATRLVYMTRSQPASSQRPPSKMRMRTRGIWVVLTIKSGMGITLDDVKKIDFRDEEGFVQAPQMLGFLSEKIDPHQAEAIEDLDFYAISQAPDDQVINAVVFEFPLKSKGGALKMNPEAAPLTLKWELTKSKLELAAQKRQEERLKQRNEQSSPQRRPVRTPTPVPETAALKWISSPTALGIPFGISQNGFYVFPSKEGTELQVFDPRTEEFRTVGPAIRAQSLVGIAGDLLLVADPQTKDCSVFDLASGERIHRYFLDLQKEKFVGFVTNRHDAENTLLVLEEVTKEGKHTVRFYPMEISSGTVSADYVSGHMQNWRKADSYDIIATKGFNRILMRNRSQGGTVQLVHTRMLGEYKTARYSHQGLSLLEDGSIAYTNGSRKPHGSRNEISGYAAPARNTAYQIAVTRKGDVCLWNPDTQKTVLDFGKLPRFTKNSSRGRQPYSLSDICFDARTGYFHYSPLLNRNGIFFGKLDLADAVSKSGNPILLSRKDPAPVIPNEPWEFTPHFLGRGEEEVVVSVEESDHLQTDGKTLRFRKAMIPENSVSISFTASFENRETTFLLTPRVADRVDGKSPVLRPQVKNWKVPHSLVDMRGESDRMLVAGGGRYLVCKIPSERHWIILDLESRQQTGQIPFGTSRGNLFAAGKTKAVSYDFSKDLFVVYSLPDGRKISTFKNPLKNQIHGLAMGSAQDEALFVIDRLSKENQQTWQWSILQVEEGEFLSTGGTFSGSGLLSDETTHWRASPDMRAIVGKISTNRESARISHIAGSWRADIIRDQGSSALSVLTGGRISSASFVYSAAKKELFRFKEQPGGLLMTREVMGAPLVAGVRENSLSTFTFYRDDSKDIRFTLKDVPELSSRKVSQHEIQERYHFDYERKLGVVSPFGSKKLLLFDWNISDLYDAPPEIILPSNGTFTAGEVWELPFTVLHSGPSVKVSLRDEPAGMELLEGKQTIQWKVPSNLKEGVSVELIATDGQERRSLHSISLYPEVPDLLDVAKKNTPLEKALLGFSNVVTGIAPSSHFSVFGYEGHLCVYDAKNGRIEIRENFVRGNSNHMALRDDKLFMQEDHTLSVLDVPSMVRKSSFDMGMQTLTDVEAPENSPYVFFAGRKKNATTEEKHVVGMLNPDKAKSVFLSGVHGTRINLSPDADAIFSALEYAHYEQMYRYDPYIGMRYPVTVTTHLHEAGSYILNSSESGYHSVQEARISGAPIKVSMNHDFTFAAITHGSRDADDHIKVTGISFYNPATMDKLAVGFQTQEEVKGFTAHPFLPLAVIWGKQSSHLVTIPDGRIQNQDLSLGEEFKSLDDMHWIDRGRKLFVIGTHSNGRKMIQILEAPIGEDLLALLPEAYGEIRSSDKVSKRIKTAYRENSQNRDPKAAEIILEAARNMAGPSEKKITPEKIGARYAESVVLISSEEGNGTGMVISRTGLIMTCDHVLPTNNRFAIHVSKKNGGTTRHEGIIVLRDPRNDVAFIRIKAERDWKPITFGKDRKLKMGEEVTTIGHPGMGTETLTYTMTKGVISNPSRNLKGHTYIQTSSPVNPGVSGGPLFDGKGNVIGMVTAKARHAEAIAFAIPSSQIVSIMREIIKETRE